MIVRLLVLVTAAVVAVVLVKIVFFVALLGVAIAAGWYAYRFVRALALAASPRPRAVRPLVQPRISVRR